MVTAAGVAHKLTGCRCCSCPVTRSFPEAPDPVLQQVEHFGDATTTVNDAIPRGLGVLRPDRPSGAACREPAAGCAHPHRPRGLRPCCARHAAGCPGRRLGFSGCALFEPVLHCAPRPRADAPSLARAAEALRSSRRPLIIAGGGVRYPALPRTARIGRRTWHPCRRDNGWRTLLPDPHRSTRVRRHHRSTYWRTRWRLRRTSYSRSGAGCRTSPRRPDRVLAGRPAGTRQRGAVRRGQTSRAGGRW